VDAKHILRKVNRVHGGAGPRPRSPIATGNSDEPWALIVFATMGWTNSHLHEFTVNGRSFGRTEPRAEPMSHVLSDRSATLAAVAPDVGTSFNYNYDFGDDWNHQITLPSTRSSRPELPRTPRSASTATAPARQKAAAGRPATRG
jgi:hypothetical protein